MNTKEPIKDIIDIEPVVSNEEKLKGGNGKKKKKNSVISRADISSIHLKMEDIRNNSIPISAIFKNAIKPENKVIEDLEPEFKEPSSNLFHVKGKGSKRQDVSKIIAENLGNRYADVTRTTNLGMSRQITQARINKFLEVNMPKLKTSLSLFVDDVCNGSYFGDDTANIAPFKFFKEGKEVTEEDLINKYMAILNPSDLELTTSEVKTFNYIDQTTYKNARRDGYACVRVIPNKKIAKDLYIKYILKETKIKYATETLVTSDEETVNIKRASNERSLSAINEYLNDLGLESITMSTDLNSIRKEVLDMIPEELISVSNKKTINYAANNITDTYVVNEYEKSETFRSFVERYLKGETNPMYSYSYEYDVDLVDEDGDMESHNYRVSPYYTFSNGGLIDPSVDDIVKSIFSNVDIKSRESYSVESLENEINDNVSNLDIFSKSILSKVGFEDIYNLDINSIAPRYEGTLGYYSIENMNGVDKKEIMHRSGELSPLELLVVKVAKKYETNNDLVTSVSMEAGSEDGFLTSEVVNNTDKRSEAELAAAVQKQTATYNKLDRMFENIKGETIEFIRNDASHYVLVGDRLVGVYSIEMNHQHIQNLVATRALMSSSTQFSNTLDNVSIDVDQVDEIMGRLMFSDAIKPIIENSMSKDFIKQNVELGYTLLKLLEENDVSLSTEFSDMARFSMYNYSKVTFIPAEELIFYRNGATGLGTSTYEEAAIPAHMYILAQEAYTSWMINEGTGMSFLTIPSGASDINGEFGMASMRDQIEEFTMDRYKLRTTLTNNAVLSHKMFTMFKSPEVQGEINLQTVDMPEFKIDKEMMLQWEQEATELVGYNSALFTSRDGNVELARKLFEMNGTKVLEILTAQRFKKKASSQLATTLLRIRGGVEYENVTAIWVPPVPSKLNNDQRFELTKTKLDIINSYIEVIDQIYETKSSTSEYTLVREYLIKKIYNSIFEDDKFINDADVDYTEALRKVKVHVATNINEIDKKKGTSK
ncbi:MAG: hypothetical protein ACRC92_20590 [Peptostreptococcaceae bacterium]